MGAFDVLQSSAMVVPAYGRWNLQVCCPYQKITPTVHRAAGTLKPLTKDVFLHQYLPRNIHFCDDGASVLMTYIENHKVCVRNQLLLDQWNDFDPGRLCYTIEPWTLKFCQTIKMRASVCCCLYFIALTTVAGVIRLCRLTNRCLYRPSL